MGMGRRRATEGAAKHPAHGLMDGTAMNLAANRFGVTGRSTGFALALSTDQNTRGRSRKAPLRRCRDATVNWAKAVEDMRASLARPSPTAKSKALLGVPDHTTQTTSPALIPAPLIRRAHCRQLQRRQQQEVRNPNGWINTPRESPPQPNNHIVKVHSEVRKQSRDLKEHTCRRSGGCGFLTCQ